MISTSLEHLIFRANPRYELLLFDHLSQEQQARFTGLQDDPQFYGLLCPRDQQQLSMKSVCQQTALLYFTLQNPGHLPRYIQRLLGNQLQEAVVKLVLDNVLEIEHNHTFLSGPKAHAVLLGPYSAIEQQGFLARLSWEAIYYAQQLDISELLPLSARMYFYNRVPASPQWRKRFAAPESVASYFGMHKGGTNYLTLSRNWKEHSITPQTEGWLIWSARRRKLARSQDRPTYKLYVSPDCAHLREAFDAVLDIFTQQHVAQFKIGRDVHGLLRPDKIVAYFASFEELTSCAEHLQAKLDGCPPQGVPFTAELAGEGLLSWGIDPPRVNQAIQWMERESWRLWVTNRLAVALLAAKQNPDTGEPWRFALERLRLDGVDTETWTPVRTAWMQPDQREGYNDHGNN